MNMVSEEDWGDFTRNMLVASYGMDDLAWLGGFDFGALAIVLAAGRTGGGWAGGSLR